jgi:hypothetical protein
MVQGGYHTDITAQGATSHKTVTAVRNLQRGLLGNWRVETFHVIDL